MAAAAAVVEAVRRAFWTASTTPSCPPCGFSGRAPIRRAPWQAVGTLHQGPRSACWSPCGQWLLAP